MGVMAVQKAITRKPGDRGVGSHASARAVGNGFDFGRGNWGATSSASVTLVIVADPQVPGSGDAADVIVALQPYANRGSATNALYVGIQPTTNRFYVEHFVSGSVNRTAYASGWTGTGAAVYVVTLSLGTVTIYRNGVDVTTARPNTTWVSDSALGDSLTVHNVGAWVYNNLTSPVYMTAGFKRILNSNEIQEISRNPWQIFEPIHRKFDSPTAAGGNSIAVPAAALTLTGYAPTIVNPVGIGVPAGSIVLTANTPTIAVTNHQTVSVPTGSLILTANVPTVLAGGNNSIAVPAGSLVLTAYAPTVIATSGGTVTIKAGSWIRYRAIT